MQRPSILGLTVGAGHPGSGRARPQLPGKAPDPGAAWQQDEVREAGIRLVSTRRRSFDALFACSGFDNFIPSASSSLDFICNFSFSPSTTTCACRPRV
jgi:hypothetical protein